MMLGRGLQFFILIMNLSLKAMSDIVTISWRSTVQANDRTACTYQYQVAVYSWAVAKNGESSLLAGAFQCSF